MKTNSSKEWKYHIILIISIILLVYPLAYMISTSFKTLNEIFSTGLNIVPQEPTLDNFRTAFSSLPVLQFLRNTLIIATIVMIAKIVTSVLAAYALVFMDFKWKEHLFYFFTITMFVPFSVIMLPNYLTLNKLGLMDTLLGVALPQLADAMGIYRIRQAMRTIPKSLVEAARIDKAGHFTALTRIVFPLVKPSIIAMSIFFFINSWNEFFWPMLILKSRENYTLTLSLQLFLDAESGSAWGTSMALASVATLVPLILYILAQRQIIGTFMQSGVKE